MLGENFQVDSLCRLSELGPYVLCLRYGPLVLDDIYIFPCSVSLFAVSYSLYFVFSGIPEPKRWLDSGTLQLAQRLWNISRKGSKAKLVRQTLDTYQRRPPLLIYLPVLVTGPSVGGIGAETALSLAAGSPACIILAGRSLIQDPTTY